MSLIFRGAVLALCLAAGGAAYAGEAAIDRAFADWRIAHRIENAVLIVEDRGQNLFRKGFGTVRVDDRVLISSLSKAITATCLGTLIRDGRLHLGTKLASVLGAELTESGLAPDGALGTVTLEELLTHRSGLGRDADRAFSAAQGRQLQTLSPGELDPRRATIDTLRSALALDSRGRYDYSTFGYVLIGQAIERVSGLPYATYCAKSVLEQAGIVGATMDPMWGFRYAAGGWALSGSEYLRFFERMPPSSAWLGPELAQWSLDAKGKEIGASAFYSLGLVIRQSGIGAGISHTGALSWNQQSPRNGRLQKSSQTYAVRDAAGISLFVYAEFCQPSEAGCSTDAGWERLARAIVQAAR